MKLVFREVKVFIVSKVEELPLLLLFVLASEIALSLKMCSGSGLSMTQSNDGSNGRYH